MAFTFSGDFSLYAGFYQRFVTCSTESEGVEFYKSKVGAKKTTTKCPKHALGILNGFMEPTDYVEVIDDRTSQSLNENPGTPKTN